MCFLNKQHHVFFLHFVYLHYSRNQLFQLTHLPCCTENTGCLGDEMIESILKQIIITGQC